MSDLSKREQKRLDSGLAKLTGDELEALLISFLGRARYEEISQQAIDEFYESDPERFIELGKKVPGILIDRLIADALDGTEDDAEDG